ncbi:intradiol ring-cleavage dioxygenase [Mucilaginibacter calamicampi]|uniref:Intradiol ring-cleavage dioxygenase n=1 Tax=Mucilaginibacter calamicampi TaxID=1302352 RepID=A0ABW2Z631_9SPHI
MNRKDFLGSIAGGLFAATAMSQGRTIRKVSDGCDGCELIYAGMPSELSNTAYLPDWNEDMHKMIVEGYLFKKDGITPAAGVTLYIYHTDSKGRYSPAPNQKLALRHGHIRGWIKTAADGFYRFYTCLPAPYPEHNEPAHIHPVVKEADTNEYYIDEYIFEGDALLTAAYRSKLQNRGGSGIVKLTKNANGWWVCKRNIVLGLNIPNY